MGFRGRSDGNLNKAFSRGSSATDPIFCKSSSATERKFLGQVLSQPLFGLAVAISQSRKTTSTSNGAEETSKSNKERMILVLSSVHQHTALHDSPYGEGYGYFFRRASRCCSLPLQITERKMRTLPTNRQTGRAGQKTSQSSSFICLSIAPFILF